MVQLQIMLNKNPIIAVILAWASYVSGFFNDINPILQTGVYIAAIWVSILAILKARKKKNNG